MCQGGDFVIYKIWGAISADWCILKFQIDSNKNYISHFGNKSFDALATPWFLTNIIKHNIQDW